jgi:hypothetical protein
MVTLHELTARARRTPLTGVCNARRYRKFAGYRHVLLANEMKLHQFYERVEVVGRLLLDH